MFATSNKKVQDNLRDGLPYPYTEQDGKEYISAMLSVDENDTDIIRIYAEPFAYNIGSCRVLEKAGFQYEGTLRCNAVKNEKVLDMKMYSILKNWQLYCCCPEP